MTQHLCNFKIRVLYVLFWLSKHYHMLSVPFYLGIVTCNTHHIVNDQIKFLATTSLNLVHIYPTALLLFVGNGNSEILQKWLVDWLVLSHTQLGYTSFIFFFFLTIIWFQLTNPVIVGRVLANGPKDQGSIPGQVIQKTQK